MALIYTFFLVFLTLMTFLITSVINEKHLLNEYKKRIKMSFLETSLNDSRINLYSVYDNGKELIEYVPLKNYVVLNEICDDGTIKFNDKTGNFKLEASDNATCEVDFQIFNDVVLSLYINGEKTIFVPDSSLVNDFTYDCQNDNVNTVVNFNGIYFEIMSNGTNECNVFYNNIPESGDNYES